MHSLFYSFHLWYIPLELPSNIGIKKLYHTSIVKNTKIASCHMPYKTWIYLVVNLNGAYPAGAFQDQQDGWSPPLLLSSWFSIFFSASLCTLWASFCSEAAMVFHEGTGMITALDSRLSNFYQTSPGPYVRQVYGSSSLLKVLFPLMPLAHRVSVFVALCSLILLVFLYSFCMIVNYDHLLYLRWTYIIV